jgi:hypothetical protein
MFFRKFRTLFDWNTARIGKCSLMVSIKNRVLSTRYGCLLPQYVQCATNQENIYQADGRAIGCLDNDSHGIGLYYIPTTDVLETSEFYAKIYNVYIMNSLTFIE